MKTLRIAYITETSPGDKHAWSGTVHYVHHALLNQGFTIQGLGPAKPFILKYFFGILNKLSILFTGKRIDYRHSGIYSRAFGRIFNAKLKKTEYDIVVVCGGTEYGAYLQTNKPVYYVLDRTIAGALNYHLILKDLWKFSEQQSVYTDRKAMLSAECVFFSSDWAARHAGKHYTLPENNIKVLPFGANLDRVPSREEALVPKDMQECRLLLVGTNWKNKGADIAYNTLQLLLKKNINARLTVVGCTPPHAISDERLTVIPFIDKNSEHGLNELWQLFTEHHFFILPTRFDCTPIVFCEASAFGLPVLSARTGGVEGHITEGINGFLLPFEDQGAAYAEKISELISTGDTYHKLCESSRGYYEERLNWEAWGREFRHEVERRYGGTH